MERKFTKYLKEWRNHVNRKPIMVRGARQVGKTYIIREFGETYFENIVVVNFDETPQIKQAFEGNNDVDVIIKELESFYELEIKCGETLLFFDEIQSCPKAIVSLRYFYEKKPDLHVITAGSLLDHTLNEFPYSMPVGRVEFAYMHPMSFSEFLLAMGQKKSYELISSYELDEKISLLIHDKLMDLLRLYVVVGGMPEAVDVYQKTGSLLEVAKVQESIVKSLEYDFAKYGSSAQQRIMGKLLRYVPKTIGQKFKYVNFDQQLRSHQIKNALELLNLSRILHIVYTTNSVSIPLKTGVNEKTFKTVFLDIGLVSHILNLNVLDLKEMVLNNEGNIAEQIVAQEIIASQLPYTDREIYYWVREKQNASSEIDYLITAGNKIMPVEVKAGKTGSLKSLNVFMAEKKMNMALRFNADLPSVAMSEMNIVLKDKSVKTKFKLISLPLYLSGEIDRIISS